MYTHNIFYITYLYIMFLYNHWGRSGPKFSLIDKPLLDMPYKYFIRNIIGTAECKQIKSLIYLDILTTILHFQK